MNNTPVLAKITWHDAHSVSSGWMKSTEIDTEPCVVITVGWMIENIKANHIVLAQSYIPSEGDIDHVMAIPVSMVVKTELL
jgi:hypothetical protein